MAMNVRGGNGYIEEWVSARLLRDAHLGSIWEGTENVVALDVARAAERQRAHDALFRDLEERLDALTSAEARAHGERVRDRLIETAARFDNLLSGSAEEREPRMAAMCERLSALICTVLLLGEADAQIAVGAGHRKLLIAGEYRRRRLDRIDPLDLGTEGVRWLDEVVDWGEVPAEAVVL
jgi:hypothetical protein